MTTGRCLKRTCTLHTYFGIIYLTSMSLDETCWHEKKTREEEEEGDTGRHEAGCWYNMSDIYVITEDTCWCNALLLTHVECQQRLLLARR